MAAAEREAESASNAVTDAYASETRRAVNRPRKAETAALAIVGGGKIGFLERPNDDGCGLVGCHERSRP
jgi:hypothetical protein